MLVSVGMSKRQVKRMLGPPGARTSTRAFLRGYQSVAVMSRRGSNQEYWMYHGQPQGHSTMITFHRGRVVAVESQPTS